MTSFTQNIFYIYPCYYKYQQFISILFHVYMSQDCLFIVDGTWSLLFLIIMNKAAIYI